MIRTVDLVISGGADAVTTAVEEALLDVRRILVVLHGADARAAQRLRRLLSRIAVSRCGQVTVVENAEVVCVDGVNTVEAVVIRSTRTGRLCAVNASRFLACGSASRIG